MKDVAVIQRKIAHYRNDFFEELYKQGLTAQLRFTVYASQIECPPCNFPIHLLQTYYPFGEGQKLCGLKGLKKAIQSSDIIIAPQELVCVSVPLLWIFRRSLCRHWIWWGHGQGQEQGYHLPIAVQHKPFTRAKEASRRFLTQRGDGILTYTNSGAVYCRNNGLPNNKVIPYFNTINVERIRKEAEDINHGELLHLQNTYGLTGKHVLLFSGSLYAKKQVDFLLRAFSIAKKRDHNLVLFILGDGPDRQNLEALQTELYLDDVYFLGELLSLHETGKYFLLSDLLVMPGKVGLAIVHGLAFGLPLVTTQNPYHAPEIDYLKHQYNGLITEYDPSLYANAIVSLLQSPPRLKEMREAALKTCEELYLTRSINRFVQGIKDIIYTHD